MKRLTLAFPFDHMSGKLGIKQDLKYPESDNKAYEAPEGKTSYARNYKPTMVAAHISRTGLQYFSIKTKSAFKNTAAARLLCALVGAVAAVYSWILKTADKLAACQVQYAKAVENGYDGTFHKWVTNQLRAQLRAKSATLSIVGPSATVALGNNPFSSASTAIAISQSILVKFWNVLTPGGITFTVDGEKGISFNSGAISNIIANSRLNVLGLTAGTGDYSDYALIGGKYIQTGDGVYMRTDEDVADGSVYTTTDVAPEE